MLENYVNALSEAVKPFGDFKTEEKGGKAVAEGELKAGTKGMTVKIECDGSTVKIKGSREYTYPIDARAAEEFQDKVLEKFSDCSCYVSGQTLTFSRFASCHDPDEAASLATDIVKRMAEAVTMFESNCVRFQSGEPVVAQEEDYDPEEDVDIVDVDSSSFHSAPVTEKDNEEYMERGRNFAEETFNKLCGVIGGKRKGNEATAVSGDKTIRIVYFPPDAEIMIAVSVKVGKDVSSMYKSYINSNFSNVLCGYNDAEETFALKVFSTPDEYSPDETEEALNVCLKAMDACIQEYSQILEKKDSIGFASDIQELLREQTEAVSEREKSVSAREEEMSAKEDDLVRREEELEERARELEEEKEAMQKEMEEERARIQEHEKQMEEEMQKYEERNTKDILRIQQLANQVATLQNRQTALGQGSEDLEEEVFRLKSRVQQLISQKAALEKKLNEKITAKEGKIRELGETISSKDAEIRKMETSIEDMAKSRAAEEAKKTEQELEDLRRQVEAMGHILTAGDLMKHFKQYEDLDARNFHAQDGGQFVVYNDESLEVRIRIGEVNYVDVSKKATVKNDVLKRLNAKNADIKFFNKGERTVARTYFPVNASVDDVERIVDVITDFFSK